MPGPARKKSKNSSPVFSAAAKKRIRVLLLLTVLAATLVIGFYLYTEWRHYQRALHARFPEFGITMPAHHSIHGIDVSRYQRYISWPAVSSMEVLGIKLGFCFIKATRGTGHVDPQFSRNWKKSKQSGMVRGAYHFFTPTQSGVEQARHFLRTVQFAPGDLPPVLDLEELGGVPPDRLRKEALLWLTTVEREQPVSALFFIQMLAFIIGTWVVHLINMLFGWRTIINCDNPASAGVGPFGSTVMWDESTALRAPWTLMYLMGIPLHSVVS